MALALGCGARSGVGNLSDGGAMEGASAARRLTLAIVGISDDRVSRTDQGITPDGDPDGEFTLTASGSFDALILVTSTAEGSPCCGQQWDTLVANDPVPPSLGFSFTRARQTVVLGVFQGAQKINDASARVSITTGTYTLFAEDSGFFTRGQPYVLYGRSNGEWLKSNVARWP